jgi:Patatin-like phospholipase
MRRLPRGSSPRNLPRPSPQQQRANAPGLLWPRGRQTSSRPGFSLARHLAQHLRAEAQKSRRVILRLCKDCWRTNVFNMTSYQTNSQKDTRTQFERIVLLLQGGGALGSYQAGVYQALAEADLHPNWVAGISIGAINAAIGSAMKRVPNSILLKSSMSWCSALLRTTRRSLPFADYR